MASQQDETIFGPRILVDSVGPEKAPLPHIIPDLLLVAFQAEVSCITRRHRPHRLLGTAGQHDKQIAAVLAGERQTFIVAIV